jgi:hypothetical protein
MGVTVPEVIGDGHAVGRDRDRIGVVSDADRGATCQALYRGPLAPGGSPRLTFGSWRGVCVGMSADGHAYRQAHRCFLV